MSDSSSRVGLVDMVWSLAGDGRWHTRNDLEKHVPFSPKELSAVVDFLVKYGFAQLSVKRVKRFKMVVDCPSPMEAANILESLGLPGRLSYYS